MRKAAAVVILEWIQVSGKASSSSHPEVFLAKQNSKVTGKLKPSIFSAPRAGSYQNNYEQYCTL